MTDTPGREAGPWKGRQPRPAALYQPVGSIVFHPSYKYFRENDGPGPSRVRGSAPPWVAAWDKTVSWFCALPGTLGHLSEDQSVVQKRGSPI